jgi:hypothetical protein
MNLTFLAAPIPLTKSYTRAADGSITKSSYPHVYEVTSIDEDCTDLGQMERLLKKHAALGHCLLKGNPTRPLVLESRAGSTDAAAATDWIVFDIDGLKDCASIDAFLKALRIDDTSHIVQWSASYGIENLDLRAHVFMQVDTRLAAPLLKQWLIQLNHSVSLLKDAMGLTRTGNALLWALDITACQNDKLIYIAPPKLKGIKDPFARKERINLVRRAHSMLAAPASINSTAQNRALTDKRIGELREKLGYPARKISYKMAANVEVMVKPDACLVSSIKAERGFVYFNLNGGDSWGYYHPEDNPEFIHNFKGEPSYLTRELLPDYWQALTAQAVRTSSAGVTYLAFCDRKTGLYWRGTYDSADDYLDLHIARNETQVRHFAKQHGMPLGDFIPEWDLVFDPHGPDHDHTGRLSNTAASIPTRVDTAGKVINLFQPSIYMQNGARAAKKTRPRACPPTVHKIIHHALGSSDETTERFINWLAYILQFRDRARTAWIMHGVPGTGKGILMNKILRPLFGQNQTAARRAEDLNEPYNAYLEQCFLVFVDEIEARALINERGVMANLKNFITEEFITVRAMYAAAHEVRNYTSWLFASNKSDPVIIDKDDRRFNTGLYQTIKLAISGHEIDVVLPTELQSFHDYLAAYAVDVVKANTPAESCERDNMISLSESSIDTVGSHLLEGNFEFFVDLLPTTTAYQSNALEFNKVENYTDVLKAILARTRPDGSCNISRDELRAVFHYAVGGVPDSPNKFTSLLKHHRMHTTKVWVDNKAVYGLATTWGDVAQFPLFAATLNPPQAAPGPKLKTVK